MGWGQRSAGRLGADEPWVRAGPGAQVGWRLRDPPASGSDPEVSGIPDPSALDTDLQASGATQACLGPELGLAAGTLSREAQGPLGHWGLSPWAGFPGWCRAPFGG